MKEGTEQWPLGSGKWQRNTATEGWRLDATPNNLPVDARLTAADIGALLDGSTDGAGHWFPHEFKFHPASGAALHKQPLASGSWIPPSGAVPQAELTKPASRGLRKTKQALRMKGSFAGKRLDATSDPAKQLPALPPGEYIFIADPHDARATSLLAVGVAHGTLHMLLPATNQWMPLVQSNGGILAESSLRGHAWGMDALRHGTGNTLYLPTTSGLAMVNVRTCQLTYEVEYRGPGEALGAPAIWAGEIWIPIRDKSGKVQLLGVAPDKKDIVLKTDIPAPAGGFEAPILDSRMVLWRCAEGQLIVRVGPDGAETAEWQAWPEGSVPNFDLGSPYLSTSGTFWQACWNEVGASIEYVQLGRKSPERAAVDAPRVGTGSISYKKNQRIKGDPWREPEHADEGASADVVYPLIESEVDATTVSLRIEAPEGLLQLLEDGIHRHRAVLQIQADNSPDLEFGTLMVAKPWLTSVFVYDKHLWIYHPDLPRVSGWKLED